MNEMRMNCWIAKAFVLQRPSRMLMNVSRPSLHRELRKLEGAGIITYAPPMITVIDRDALQDVLSQ